MPRCVHGIEQDPPARERRWFEQASRCPQCEESRRGLQAEIEALEARLRDVLPADDGLHPDNYRGPFGMLWFQAVAFRLAALGSAA